MPLTYNQNLKLPILFQKNCQTILDDPFKVVKVEKPKFTFNKRSKYHHLFGMKGF